MLDKNGGEYNLYGGFVGFYKKIWQVSMNELDNSVSVIFKLYSFDGEGGFLGNVKVEVCYILNNDNEFLFEFFVMIDKEILLSFI